jgi:hypothetical protein
MDFRFYTPVIIYMNNILCENLTVLQSYLFRMFEKSGVPDPLRLFVSVICQHVTGIAYQSHFREVYPEIKAWYTGVLPMYRTDKIKEYITVGITDGMLSWKLIMFNSFILRTRCPELLCSPDGKTGASESGTADFDASTMQSSSSLKEGAVPGYNKKNKGKSCFQFFATFVGRVSADGKIFPGYRNPKDFFRKAVKRLISLGYNIKTVRADSAFMTLDNLLFLKEMRLGYAPGAPATFSVVKKGTAKFRKLSRQKSSAVISVAKGVSVYDYGMVTLANGVGTRILIIRRINRRKNRKTGQWKIKTYYYAISSDPGLSPRKLYEFYHKRQCIEAGFRELKQHWHPERLPFQKLIHNEFWILCKIFSMTLFKIFQVETLPKKYHTLQRRTFFRRVLCKGLRISRSGKVEIVLKARYTWLLQRLLSKTAEINPILFA